MMRKDRGEAPWRAYHDCPERTHMSPRINRRTTLKGLAALTCIPLIPMFGFASEDPHVLGTPPADALRNDSFDDGWRFHRGDVPGDESPALPDDQWRKLTLPHDW